MLLHLLPSAIDSVVQRSQPNTVDCLENILRAHREGKHIVSGEPARVAELIRVATSARFLSNHAIGSLRDIKARSSEISGLRKDLRWYVELNDNAADSVVRVVSARQSVVEANIHWFDDSLRSQCSVLLAEDLKDVRAYEVLARAYAAFRQWKGMKVRYEHAQGGGANTWQAFESKVKEGRICLCVCDSDRKHPHGALGSTAKKVQTAAAKSSPMQQLRVLASREIENLLPTQLYAEAIDCFSRTPQALAIAQLQMVEQTVDGDWRQFVDMKLGICRFDIFRSSLVGPERDFWTRFDGLASVQSSLGVVRCDDPYQCSERKCCNCVVVVGLGDSILEKALDLMERCSSQKLAELIKFDVDAEFADVCAEVFAFGCTFGQKRT